MEIVGGDGASVAWCEGGDLVESLTIMTRPREEIVLAVFAAMLLSLGSLLGGCSQARGVPTPTPTKTPRPALAGGTAVPTVVLPALPSATQSATATQPPDTPAPASPTAAAPTATATPAPSATSTPEPLPTSTRPRPTAAPTLPPQRGGDWDLEAGFYAWQSPHEGFTAFVANGWQPLSAVHDPDAPPRLNENKYLPNVRSGERSQEVSFDWRSGEAGIWRSVEVVPGHRYLVEAWAKYVPSESGLALHLGIDLGGGEDFTAGSVTWHPWRDLTPNQWIATQETVRATGARLTIFLRAVHPMGVDGGNKPGGNTMFDNVSVVDLGP